MSTELKFDEATARALLQTVPRMKPRGVARIYCPEADFEFDGGTHTARDALVLTPGGNIIVQSQDWIDHLFEPVAKRTRKASVVK